MALSTEGCLRLKIFTFYPQSYKKVINIFAGTADCFYTLIHLYYYCYYLIYEGYNLAGKHN